MYSSSSVSIPLHRTVQSGDYLALLDALTLPGSKVYATISKDDRAIDIDLRGLSRKEAKAAVLKLIGILAHAGYLDLSDSSSIAA